MVAIVLSVILLCTNILVIADAYDNKEYYFLQEEDFFGLIDVYIDEHYYFIFDYNTEWDEARLFCESVGGHLITIDNELEETAIKKMLGSESYMMEAY